MRTRQTKTSRMLRKILETPIGTWIEFSVGEAENPDDLQHRIRVKLSKLRRQVRELGRIPADFTLGCRFDNENRTLHFIRTTSMAHLHELDRRQGEIELTDLLASTPAKEILEDV